MTQEEKARAYDEALEKIKPLYEQAKKDGNPIWSTYEYLIPELAESEDERIKNKSGYYKAGKFWKASTLWNAVKDKSPQRVPNRYILQECTWNISSLQHFADEVKNVQEVDLNYPIILDMNGNILDGAHRVVKAYLEGKDIDIVYLGDDEWPEPDYDEEKAVKDSEDERIRKALINALKVSETIGELEFRLSEPTREEAIAYLEKQKDVSKAIEAVERIDKYIDENLANAHDMKDSNPDKKYYRGWDDALGEMARILQDVYSNEKQKESLRDFIDNFPYSVEKEQKPVECELEDAFKYYTDRGITISCGDIKAEPKEQELVEVEGEEIQRVFGEDKSTGEWSDTNELVFQDICKHLKEEGYDGWVVLLNALRNGEFQPKQEWSEEDEKMRRC